MIPSRILNKSVLLILLVSAFILSACGGKDSDELRYVAIGASDATGIGAEPLSDGYVFKIEDGVDAALDTKRVSLVNLGIPSATVNIIEDIALPLAKNANPDFVTIFVGGNDVNNGFPLDDFTSNLRSIVKGVASDTHALIFIATLPDISKLPKLQDSPKEDVTTETVVQFNQAITTVAGEFGATVVDLFAEPIEDYLVSDDGFHPNNQGYQKIADKFLEVMIPQLSARYPNK